MSDLESHHLRQSFAALQPADILSAVESLGYLSSGHCEQLNSLENRVYDVRLEDGRHVVVKFYRPGRWSRSAIQSEHDFLYELQADEIPVCAPLRLADGQSLHEQAGIFFALWWRTGGRCLDELGVRQATELGRLLGRIHNVGARTAFQSNGRLILNQQSYLIEPLQYLLENDWPAPEYRHAIEDSALDLARLYEQAAADIPLLRIHGDCHIGNLLHSNEGWFFLDFDDCLMGPAVQDFWMLLPGRLVESEPIVNALLDGYRLFRDFEPGWLGLIEILRAMRYVHYSAWIARRWHDPAFQQAFEHFNTGEYWQNLSQDLRDQLDSCQSAVAPHTLDATIHAGGTEWQANDDTEALENSAYFYDWTDNGSDPD